MANRIIIQSHSLLMMLLFSKWFWLLLVLIIASWIPLSQPSTTTQQAIYPSSASLDASLSNIPILSLFNECLDFMHLYLNSTSIALLTINNIAFESFGEDTQQQQTVYLRSHANNQPIAAIHTEIVHILFLNITSLELSFINHETQQTFTLNVDLAHSAQNRWAPITFLSSSHLPSLQSIQNPIKIHTIHDTTRNTKIRVMTINLWNYNYWIQRLHLIDEILHRYKPDIIGLQELRIRSRYLVPQLYPYDDPQLLHTFQIYDMITLLTYFSESRGSFQWYTAPAMFFKESTPEQYPEHIVGEGLGIISKFPIRRTHKLKLSRNMNDGLDFHQRLLLGVTVEIHRDSDHHYDLLDVYTTHLSLSEKARTRTLPEIGEYINNKLQINTKKHHKVGAVLMGDFNCEFDYIQPKLDVLSSPKYNMVDVWKASGKCGDNKDEHKKYSYNYKHNREYDDIHAMFQSPNAYYYNLSANITQREVAVYDFNAWSKYMLNGENKKDDDEWWRDDRCKNGWTFNAWKMRKRIDYFYVNKELLSQINDIQIVGSDVFQSIQDLDAVGGVRDMQDKLYASDHRFLYIDIEVKH